MSITSLYDIAHIPVDDIDPSLFSTLWYFSLSCATSKQPILNPGDIRSDAVCRCISIIDACNQQPPSSEHIRELCRGLTGVPLYGMPLCSFAYHLVKQHVGDEVYTINPQALPIYISDYRSSLGYPIGQSEVLTGNLLSLDTPSNPSQSFVITLAQRYDVARLVATFMPSDVRVANPPDGTLDQIASMVCLFSGIRCDQKRQFSYQLPPPATPRYIFDSISACLDETETRVQRALVAELIMCFVCATLTAPLSIHHVRLARGSGASARALGIAYIIRSMSDSDVCKFSPQLNTEQMNGTPLGVYPSVTRIHAQATGEQFVGNLKLTPLLKGAIRDLLVRVAREVKKDV